MRVEAVVCPRCGAALDAGAGSWVCASGHSFDVARQGYVNLRPSRPAGLAADTAEMVQERDAFLGAGHYAPIAEALARLAAEHAPRTDGVVLDIAGGTGYYLTRVLDALPAPRGVCLDLSTPALKRAARAHPRVTAIGADVWDGLPLADGSVGVAMTVFGPRNADEVARVLERGAPYLVVTPTPEHLRELVEPLGLVAVDETKEDRLRATLAGFDLVAEERVVRELTLDRASAFSLARMGPSAHHATREQTQERVARLADPTVVTLAVRIGVYRVAAL
ncbi:23S rRNA (guanine745-N1)-methyltransferase [Diaminobutyricimonas aerilata]|uniref:23S rRNA (Guanine745-N1)-methyltransferase n=1 Tax=Diaminobutyricimonas aerilata TaxID=1162967 RepID=A0A2M9CNV5_9MICO|nr:methyltransferase domain-containing protein [Diaminobutyricimonas aerilata]PJJ73548.1 23S rRNA (guanine745-N1)-methyltransferase [Diaminobutyricimonas aerilata]